MSSFLSFGEQLDHVARFAVAYGVMAVFFMFELASLSSAGTGLENFPFFLIVIYYWSLFRPAVLPFWLVGIAGFFSDAVLGTPLGMNALLYVLVRLMIGHQRRYLTGQTFLIVWLGFSFALAFSILFKWFVVGLIHFNFSSLNHFGFMFFCGMMIFPLVNMILQLTHKLLPIAGNSMRLD